MRRRLRRYWPAVSRYAGMCSTVGVLAVAVFAACNVAVVSLDPQPYQEKIRQGFLEGALSRDDYPWTVRGQSWDGYSDCAVLEAMVERSTQLGDAFRPSAHPEVAACEALLRKVTLGSAGMRLVRPTRYWYGARVVPAIFLRVMSYRQMQVWLLVLQYSLPLVILGVPLVTGRRLVFYAMLPVASGLIGLLALPLFGPSIAFAPGMIATDLTLLGILLLETYRRAFRRTILLACVSGAVQLYFETMMGAIVICLTLLLGSQLMLSSVGNRRRPARAAAGRMLVVALAFSIGAVVTALGDIVCASAVVGVTEAFGEYVRAIAHRVNDEPASTMHLWGMLWAARHELNGHMWTGTAAILGGLACWGGTGLLAAHRWRQGDAQVAWRWSALAFAALPCLMWLVVLRNHVLHHAWLDIRVLGPVISLGAGAAWICLYEGKSRGSKAV